jgi:trans-aconitate methyltransferase
MSFSNVYNDAARAAAYSKLEFPGTYYLVFRDLPQIISEHVRGPEALDFGCGAGRSTRFLQQLGFQTIGIDVSESMIALARDADPAGDYRLVPDGDFNSLEPRRFDLILSAFAFDNIPDRRKRTELLRRLRGLLNVNGRIVMLGSTPEIYTHEWASFTTKDFPHNRESKGGDTVQIVMKDVADSRPVVDIVWFHQDYLKLFADSNLRMLAEDRPLGHKEDPCEWLSETTIAPWMIYVLGQD